MLKCETNYASLGGTSDLWKQRELPQKQCIYQKSFLDARPPSGDGRKERPPAGGTPCLFYTYVLDCDHWSEGTPFDRGGATTGSRSLRRETVATRPPEL